MIECVLNFSEGRRPEVIAQIASAARVPGVAVLHLTSDADHNRSVITFAGNAPDLEAATLAIVARSLELIDLTRHRGEHPRIGAVDVVPFVPLRGSTLAECVELARRTGQRIGNELHVPVYLYGDAALRPQCVNLPDIRSGQFEGLAAKMADPLWTPDFGPAQPHPTGGAVAVGARGVLVAFNIVLNTPDVRIARKIARAIRARDGGLANVRALGLFLEQRNLAQVSINLLNPYATPLYRVVETVRFEAARYGISIRDSEVIGLVPNDILLESARYYLQLKAFKRDQIIEVALEKGRPEA